MRYEQRVKKGLDSINGVALTPKSKAIELGRASVAWRANATVAAIRKALSLSETTQP